MNRLAIDVGSSTVKAAVLDTTTHLPLAEPVKVGYKTDSPADDAFEIPPQRLQQAAWEAARLAVAAVPGTTIHSVGLSCLMPALVLLDSNDEPLSPIWIHLDRRSRPLAKKVLADVGERFLAEIGNRPLPGGISALCYAQQLIHSPNLRSRVKSYLHANGWLAYLMTGQKAFDVANASFTGLWNTMSDQQWSPYWCEYFQVEPQWLPRVVCGSTTIGTLAANVAHAWGLSVGLPVIIGTADTSSGMLSAKMQPGDLLHSVGTTQVLGTLVEKPKPDPRRLTRMFGVGRHYCYVAHNPVGGSALNWLHALCYADQSAQEFFDRTCMDAIPKTSSIELDPPFLGGDRLEIEARYAAFKNLTLATKRDDLLVAVLNAMKVGHRLAFDALDWGNHPIKRIILTGGGHEVVRALIPDYRNAEIEVIDEGALLGISYL